MAATYNPGDKVIYQGSLWTVPTKGQVVTDDGGDKLHVSVERPDYNPMLSRMAHLHCRRSSITPA